MYAFIYKPLLYCCLLWGVMVPVKHVKKAFHPIHVSTTNIEYNKQSSKVEVICTIFTDDFEAALEKQYHTKIDLSKNEMHTAMEALVKKYVAGNLQIKTGAAPLTLNYLGFEINKEAVDIYLESDKIPAFKKVDVDVSLMHNLFNDQINIVHITINGVRKSEKLDYPDKKLIQVF
jgi:light-regulated signal transduction histidine kinase (bacteriophytochrome)